MPKAALIASVSLLLVATPLLAAQMTVSQYLALESAEAAQGGSPVARVYLMGALEVLGYANAALAEAGHARLYCLPDGAQPQVQELQTLLRARIEELRATLSAADWDNLRSTHDVTGVALATLRQHDACP